MRGLSAATKELIWHAYYLLKETHPQTLRQLHYAIFSRNEIVYDNSSAEYKRLSRATTYARRLHRQWELADDEATNCPALGIPGEWIIDGTREAISVSMWDDVHAYLSAVKRSYRRDNWHDQPYHVEVWSEKATVLGSIKPTADKFGITLRVCRGFGSTGMESEIGRDFEFIEKPIVVFFLGDHDPSGREIEHDIHRRAQAASGREIDMSRLAIHPGDIQAHKLPPQKIKATDSRAASFRKKYGKNAATVELDALPVAELRWRISEAVSRLIDREAWDRHQRVQEVEIQCIADFADRVKNLPQINPEMRP